MDCCFGRDRERCLSMIGWSPFGSGFVASSTDGSRSVAGLIRRASHGFLSSWLLEQGSRDDVAQIVVEGPLSNTAATRAVTLHHTNLLLRVPARYAGYQPVLVN